MAAMFHGYAGDFRKAAEYEKQAQRHAVLPFTNMSGDSEQDYFVEVIG
jgi:TolB-like protein